MYLQKKIIPEILLFIRAQLSAFIGGLVDFAVMLLLTELLGVFYVYSIVAGGLVGAVANFSINKFWTFENQESNAISQISKFSLVVLGSIFLKSGGTFLLTEGLDIQYWIARIRKALWFKNLCSLAKPPASFSNLITSQTIHRICHCSF